MIEYGVFNDEGMLEGDLWSPEAAEAARRRYVAEALMSGETLDEVEPMFVREVCGQCRGGAVDECDCPAEDSDDDEDDE